MKDNRKNKKEWRKFSFKELVFFHIIKELRKYGLNNEQLKSLKDSFFKTKPKSNKIPIKNEGNNKYFSEIATALTFSKQQVILTINNNFEADYFDLLNFSMFGNDCRIEGIVWYCNNGDMYKIKCKDF